MPTPQSEDDKKRRDPRTESTGASEPQIPDVDPADLDDDQADSGPDRDHKELSAKRDLWVGIRAGVPEPAFNEFEERGLVRI